MDHFSKLNFKTDTSIALIKSAIDLNINIWISHPSDLTLRNKKLSVNARRIIDESFRFQEEAVLNVDKFDFVLIRQDPPFDMNYISNCYLLEIHKQFNKKPIFINDPSGIKNFTEKIYPLYFSHIMPETLITSNLNVFYEMLNNYKSVVVKPLYFKGGDGIKKFCITNKKAKTQFKKMLSEFKTPLVVQEFLKKVNLGDKRVLLLDGKPFGVVNRIPKSGQFKANLHLGGKAAKASLTKMEKKICKSLEKSLLVNDLFFVGIDLIDEKLTEINVTSPTGITQLNQLYKLNYSNLFWEKLLNKYSII